MHISLQNHKIKYHFRVNIVIMLCVIVLSVFCLQVYYIPMQPFYNQCVLPTVFSTLPLLRNIFLREKISLVHGHSVGTHSTDTLTVPLNIFILS